MGKHLLQVREKHGDKRWWTPDRDITSMYPRVIRWVFHSLGAALWPGDDSFSCVAYDARDKLKISDEEIVQLGKVYANIINCVETSQDVTATIGRFEFKNNRAQILVALLFLEKMTEQFADRYKDTVHKGEEDPQRDMMEELVGLLAAFGTQPSPWWRTIWKRVRYMWVILRCPLIDSGYSWERL